jgi:DNA-binding transcriptional ArsR family regulator
VGGPLDERLDPVFFKALGDPTRAKLVACIAKCGRACSVGEVGECCSVDLSVVSRHLRVLERAGVVESVKAGRTVRYMVRYAAVSRSLRGLAEAIEQCRPRAGEAGVGGCEGGVCCGER